MTSKKRTRSAVDTTATSTALTKSNGTVTSTSPSTLIHRLRCIDWTSTAHASSITCMSLSHTCAKLAIVRSGGDIGLYHRAADAYEKERGVPGGWREYAVTQRCVAWHAHDCTATMMRRRACTNLPLRAGCHAHAYAHTHAHVSTSVSPVLVPTASNRSCGFVIPWYVIHLHTLACVVCDDASSMYTCMFHTYIHTERYRSSPHRRTQQSYHRVGSASVGTKGRTAWRMCMYRNAAVRMG